MSENQKEEQVITNNQSSQQNQSKQSNEDNQKKSGDVSQVPPVIHEDKIQTEVPERHHVKDHERDQKTPVVSQQEQEENNDEVQEKEISDPVLNEKQNNKIEAE